MRRSDVLGLLIILAASLGAGDSAAAGEVVVLVGAPVDAYEEALGGFEQSLRGHRIAPPEGSAQSRNHSQFAV